jgi:hypothetical protein
MPLTIPTLDDRKYQDLLNEALARIPVYTPEWTNFNSSDPGVTLIEVFAFLTESLLYRSNQIPERNRRKFLGLLGVGLQPASSALGLVTFANERGPLDTVTLTGGIEVRAGQVPFRTDQGLDVLPIEAQVFYKRAPANPSEQLKTYYRQLYASFTGQPPSTDLLLYETVKFPSTAADGIDLGQDTIDGSIWIALLARPNDSIDEARRAISGKTLNLGMVPLLTEAGRRLVPGGPANPAATGLLTFELPLGGTLPADAARRTPSYVTLDASSPDDVLSKPGVVQIGLPDAARLILWDNLDPLEEGVGAFPPTLQDTSLNGRLLTWLKVRSSAGAGARFLWVGINAAFVSQRTHVANEILPAGTGAPDQTAVLSRTPVIPDSVKLTVTANTGNAKPETWTRIDDITSAGSEVPAPDPRQPPGTPMVINPLVKAFTLDPESGLITFGDGNRGARPPFGAQLRADYDFGSGRDGNVGAGSINSGPALPAGLKVSNPVPTWGGAAAETVADGEKQITRFLQHRDRLVNPDDFRTITKRTPGVDIGRVEVLPAFNPDLSVNEPGDAPGAVTLMLIPSFDPVHPDTPEPDRAFLDAVCGYLEPRRLVTTELFLRGPTYVGIWISIGIDVLAGAAVATVREAVKQVVTQFLSPLPPTQSAGSAPTTQEPGMENGWPLRKPVIDLELMAVASRVPGVLLINKVLLAQGNAAAASTVSMSRLQLPRILGISVVVGDATDLNQLRGTGVSQQPSGPTGVPVPVIPEEC